MEFLLKNKDYNFIECSSVKSFEKRNNIYFPGKIVGRKLWQKVTKNFLIYITGGWNYTFSILKRKAPNGVDYYFGSSWWCLNQETTFWICDYLKDYPQYMKFFKASLCADECFFQTLVMNSPFSECVKPYLHFIKWEEGKSSPKTLGVDDIYDLLKSQKMLARKFDIDMDMEVIREINLILSNRKDK